MSGHRRVAPSGTVTFLFTDIEGSTRLWQAHPEEMRVWLAEHDRLLREAFEKRAGYVFKHTGDGMCAAFASAADAIDAAVDAQASLAGLPILVRMGLYTGEAQQRGGDYFGPTLNRCARLMGVAHGGQIVVAASTAELVRDRGDLRDLGEHRLRDLAQLERVHQAGTGEFAPLKSLNTVPGNLPILLTSFVGRNAEIAGLIDAITRHRVVTITGVGGVGKTRTALQAGAETSSRFRDGVWFVEFAPLADPELLGNAVAATLGLQPRPGMTLLESVYAYLVERQLLLILDNCEHVLVAASEMVDRVSRSCPGVHLLVTSREDLALDGEQVWPLPSLTDGADAVQLFLDRAQGVVPSFVLSDGDRVFVDEICTRLDRIPLAIELAAVRVTTLSPGEIADRLDQRFRLLISGRRNAGERHHTLHATVEWSYELLDLPSRLLFNRLSVFAGGFTLEAAEAVAAGDRLDRADVLDLLAGLVAKSMVVADTARAGGRRYRLLETLRQFAFERLVEAGDIDAVKERHARYIGDFAAAAGSGWRSRDEQRWRKRIEAEIDNLRAAVAWACNHEQPELAARLVAPFVDVIQFQLALGLDDLARAALAVPGIDEQSEVPAVFVVAALATFHHGDLTGAGQLAERAISISHQPGHRPHVAAWTCLSAVGMWRGDLASAAQLGHQAWDVANELDDPYQLAYAASVCAFVTALDPTVGIARVEHILAAVIPVAGPEMSAWVTSMAGNSYCESAMFEQAIDTFEKSVELALIVEGSTAARWTYAPLAVLLGEHRSPLTGLRTARSGITESHAQGALAALVWDLESAATVLAMANQHEPASVIYAAVDLGIVAPFVIMEQGWQRDVRVRGRTATAAVIGSDGAARAVQRARSMNVASLVEYTLDHIDRIDRIPARAE
jgi:predicted ATPase/class 3 adenylate cyclase